MELAIFAPSSGMGDRGMQAGQVTLMWDADIEGGDVSFTLYDWINSNDNVLLVTPHSYPAVRRRNKHF